MIINLDKTVVIHYGKNSAKGGLYGYLSWQKDSHKLGLIVDEKLDFMKHFQCQKKVVSNSEQHVESSKISRFGTMVLSDKNIHNPAN